MSEFFQMGGYAVYVWGAVGFTVVVLVANLITARRFHLDQRGVLARRYRQAEPVEQQELSS